MDTYGSGRCWLAELPIELQSLILQQLHLNTFSAFARTSRHSYKVVRFTLSSLNIAVFHRRVHGLLAVLNDDSDSLSDECEDPAWYRLVVPAQECSLQQRRQQPLPPNVQRVQKIMKQNASLEEILRTPMLAELSSLTVNTYGLLSTELGRAMAGNLSRLRRLTLNFAHPYIHDPMLPPRYWKTCPDISAEGSLAWNALAGFGDQYSLALRMTGLQTLSITRAAITSAQLAKWIDVSKELYELRLDMVSGVDKNFVEWLADTQVKQRQDRSTFRVLSIQRCPGLHMRRMSDARWIQDLVDAGLHELSLRGCHNVNSKLLRNLVREQGWESGALLKLVYPEQSPEDTSAESQEDDDYDDDSQGDHMCMDGFDFGRRPLGAGKIDVNPAYMA